MNHRIFAPPPHTDDPTDDLRSALMADADECCGDSLSIE